MPNKKQGAEQARRASSLLSGESMSPQAAKQYESANPEQICFKDSGTVDIWPAKGNPEDHANYLGQWLDDALEAQSNPVRAP